MNEIIKRKLNPTETIKKSLPAIIEAFVTFYGESERERITSKFNNMLIIGYSKPENIINILNTSDKEKSNKLINEFLNKLTSDKEEQEKLKKLFFDDNSFEFSTLQPINKYINYKKELNVNNYTKIQIVNFLKQIYPEVTIDNLDELIKNETFKNIDIIIPLYEKMLIEYQEYKKETKPYEEYVKKCSDLKENLIKKHTKKMIEELKDLFTESELKQIKDELNKKYYSSIKSLNAKTKNYTGYSINGSTLIEAFSQENEELLNNGNSWRVNSIKSDRIEYFKNFGLDLGNDYQAYLNDPRAQELIPSQELIDRIKNSKNKAYTNMMNEYYISLPEYQKNIDMIESEGLLQKDYGYNANAYETGKTAICTNIKQVNGEYIVYPIYLQNMGNLEGYLDHTMIHELNHAYELTLKSIDENGCELCCGWDILYDKLNQETDDIVSLEDRKEKRNYELFNEIINELIAQEISEIINQTNQYIFNTKEDKKIIGGTNYERTKFLVKNFYETYKKEIIESRRNGNIEVLFNAIGKENFESLNELFHEYYENFNIGFGMLQVYKDLDNNVETELTKKFKEIIAKRNVILANMEEHNKNRGHSL